MTPLRGLAAALLAAGLCLGAQAQDADEKPVRGWLKYADGNTLSGVLVARMQGGGVFRTDRFGEVSFKDGEARFEADPAEAVAEAPKPASPVVHGGGWRPASWSIGVSGYWQQKSESTTSNISLDLDATWRSPRDEIKFALSADYKVVDDDVDNNEQTGSLRWVRELRGPWVGLGNVRLQRSTFSPDGTDTTYDYVLVQASVGVGWRQQWTPDTHTLIALNRERIALDLLNFHRRAYDHATSLLLENHLRLGPRLHFDNTLLLYHWPDGDTGVDSTTEVGYDLTANVRVGLRHESRRNSVNVDLGHYSRLSLTTRVAF